MSSPLACWLFHTGTEIVTVNSTWAWPLGQSATRYRCPTCKRMLRRPR